MPPQIPTLAELFARLLADGRARLPGADWSRGSDNWKRLRIWAGASIGLYHHVKVSFDQLLPDTAEGVWLDRIGAIWDVARRGATPARKADALRVTGTVATAITTGEQLVSDSGLRYQVNENATVGALGYVDVDVVAVDTGAATRLDAGATLTFVSPPAGITAKAVLQLDLDEDGEDQESDGAYRERILNRIGLGSAGGNANDYRQWALASAATIATAYVYPNRAGRGTVDIAALHAGSGTARLLTAAERTALKDYIGAIRPVATRGLRVLEVTTRAEDIEVLFSLLPGSGNAWDWDDSTPLTPASHDQALRQITMAADLPADIDIGDRICFKNTDGQLYTIEDIPAADTIQTSVEVSDIGAGVIVTDHSAYAGGDLSRPLRDAVIAHVASFGPAIGDAGVGDWFDALKPSRLVGALYVDVPGVYDVDVSTPAATVTPEDPAYPSDDSIELIIHGAVLVRRKW